MGDIVLGLGSSHAFTFMEPKKWAQFADMNRSLMQERTGVPTPVQRAIQHETLPMNQERYARIRDGLNCMAKLLRKSRPDVLLVIGDDQNENLSPANMPQLAIYTGRQFKVASPLATSDKTYENHREWANSMLEYATDEGFDIASLGAFSDSALRSHAHAQVLDYMLPDADIPVVLVFMNAIHHPAIKPERCYQFGKMLARFVDGRPEEERVAIYASGGWSHFTAGYPWSAYRGDQTHGAIDSVFDRAILEAVAGGAGERLATLTGADLLEHGDIELRAWIALLGVLGHIPASFIHYEAFYSALMGMAVAAWESTER